MPEINNDVDKTTQNPLQTGRIQQPIHFDTLTKENASEFLERRIQDFSSRYAELYSNTLGVDETELSQSVREKLKSSYTKVTIEETITGSQVEVKSTKEGKLVSSNKGNPLIAAKYGNNRNTGEGEFSFKPYADRDDVLNTKTIYHEFLHALGGTMRPDYAGETKYSLGVNFDHASVSRKPYQPFEEGFTEIIAAEMVGIEPQSYTYEVPICVLIRKIIGDKSFLQAKSGDLDPLLSEFAFEELEELRDVLSVYDGGIRSKFANAKYLNRENRTTELRSTETVVNEYIADESYIAASKRLTTFFIDDFDSRMVGVRTQQEADELFDTLANCQTTQQDILPPGNYYESSIPAINQALSLVQARFVSYCQDNDLHIDTSVEFSPQYTQDRQELVLDFSVSDLQLQLLEQDILDIQEKPDQSATDSILLLAKKWLHTSIQTQQKYRQLFPGHLNRHSAYPKQLEAVRQIDPDFQPKFEFPEIIISNIPDLTFTTGHNITFTKGGYHGSLPDYGYLIARSLNVEFLKKIFGDYVAPTLSLGKQAGVLTETDLEKAKTYLQEINQIIETDSLTIVANAKALSQKTDGLLIDPDTLRQINQLTDLRINDVVGLHI